MTEDVRHADLAWTNKSVLALAEDDDPIDVIVTRAREAVLAASEAGWSGPPFDPLLLAQILGVPTVARDDLRDARVTADADGRPRIEFNPTRPRGRLRYSIAHEIAHTFFPDVTAHPRHRTGMGAIPADRDDSWQLELLCNIAAAELVMPAASFPMQELDEADLDIDRVMVLRAQFEVSTEALLRRVAQETSQPVVMFAAARQPPDSPEGRFRIDYVVPSRTASVQLVRGEVVTSRTLIDCTAVGYTAKGREHWPPERELEVQGVGIPAYPGDPLPRIAGFVRRTDAGRESALPTIRYVTGTAVSPRGNGPRMIVHIVNDAAHAWGGGGFATQLGREYPQAEQAYRMWTIANPDNLLLGNVHVVEPRPELFVASLVAQQGYGRSDKPRLRYGALLKCLQKVAVEAVRRDATVHMPRIGLGQGGAKWGVVAEALDETLCRQGIPVTVYTRPGEHVGLVWGTARGK